MSEERATRNSSHRPRVSKSQSGLSEDGSEFLLVYKYQDGTCTKPVRLAIADARKVAVEYKETGQGNRKLKVSGKAAKFVRECLNLHGLLPDHVSTTDTVEDVHGKAETIEISMPKMKPKTPVIRQDDATLAKSVFKPDPNVKPRYIPELHPLRTPVFDPENVLDVTFILSGVDPAKRKFESLIKEGKTLKDLARMPSSEKIASNRFMRQDHRYILYHLSGLSDQAFDRVYEQAKNPVVSQASTDLLKLCRSVDKIELDDEGKALADPDFSATICRIREQSPEILFRFYKGVRRELDRLHNSTVHKQQEATNFVAGLKQTFGGLLKKKAEPTEIAVEPEAVEVVENFFRQLSNLGRVLRTDVAKRK